MLDPPSGTTGCGTKVEDALTVLAQMHLRSYSRAESDQLLTREVADVDGVLQSLAEIDRDLVDSAQALRVADVVHDEVADELGHRQRVTSGR